MSTQVQGAYRFFWPLVTNRFGDLRPISPRLTTGDPAERVTNAPMGGGHHSPNSKGERPKCVCGVSPLMGAKITLDVVVVGHQCSALTPSSALESEAPDAAR